MPLDKPYLDIPGTTIFDAEQSRKGYWLNQFCMSLMKAENRARFKANERAYLDEWPMTEAQKQAVLARDLNAAIASGGNIYFLAKIGATDGKSFLQMAASMTGMSEAEYRDMMLSGRPLDRGQPRDRRGRRRAGIAPAAGQRRSRLGHARGESADGAHHRLRLHEPRAGDRRGDRSRQDGGALLATAIRGIRRVAALVRAKHARRHLSRLQRPRHVVQPGDDSDLRDRRRRRNFRPPTRAGGRGPCPRSSGTRRSRRTSRRA